MTHEIIRFEDGTIYISRSDTGFVSSLTVERGGIRVRVEPSLGAIFMDAPNLGLNIYSDKNRRYEFEAFDMFDEGVEVSSARQVLESLLRYMKDTLGVELPGVEESLEKEKPSS